MIVLGLTGRICSGKNLAAGYLTKAGFSVVDVDRLGHEVLERESALIRTIFGNEVLTDDGSGIDRVKLGSRVFSDKSGAALQKLESVVHPLMVETCRTYIAEQLKLGTCHGVVLNAALLSRMRLDELCTHAVYIASSFCIRFNRARRDRGMNLRQFLHRNSMQRDITPRTIRAGLPIIQVGNNTSTRSLEKKLDSIMKLMDIESKS